MKLEISDPQNLLDKQFGQWLIQRIQEKFILQLDESKLVVWDNYFNESKDFVSIYSTKIRTRTILLFAIKNLICYKLPGKVIIQLRPNQFVAGLDRVKLDAVVRLITFGTASMKGYPLLINIFEEVAQNINNYVDDYSKGIL